MKFSVICFTARGLETARKVVGGFSDVASTGSATDDLRFVTTGGRIDKAPGNTGTEPVEVPEFEIYVKSSKIAPADDYINVKESVSDWAGEQMHSGKILLFVGAVGIAVRAIAPHIKDKLHDSPVIVIDEVGMYCVPLLSGHVGGANEIAVMLSELLGAVPVITTATDINGKFAVDVFAKKNNLFITDKSGIARVSSKILSGEGITFSAETGLSEDTQVPDEISLVLYPPETPVDVLVSSNPKESGELLTLRPRRYVIGMGCRKNVDVEKVEAFVADELKKLSISTGEVAALASIDIKKDENALISLSRRMGIPFLTYTSDELNGADADFTASDFVKSKTGVDNVCERSAYMGCREMSINDYQNYWKKSVRDGGLLDNGRANEFKPEFVLCKTRGDKMTLAVAAKPWYLNFEY